MGIKNYSNTRPLLGVNIDHVATLRNVRDTTYPDLSALANIVLQANAQRIVMHLREDSRHIRENDVWQLCRQYGSNVNLEIAPTSQMFNLVMACKPATVCMVPENRMEKTTENGMDLTNPELQQLLLHYIPKFKHRNIEVSCFINPDIKQLTLAKNLGFDVIELHTGVYADYLQKTQEQTLSDLSMANFMMNVNQHCQALSQAASWAEKNNMIVHAGHGLHANNLKPLLSIPQIRYFHIGHSIICRALTVGMMTAVQEILAIIKQFHCPNIDSKY